ncbi:unnamed protein product [Schistosoma mattheei]|uniref:Uncharacterized protein n=1 Tax=Schistosoma mattheei TaxID=31246 RepID=A0A183P1J6_9TREM|nr:unnamed protein product [Schistosoma mattheei]
MPPTPLNLYAEPHLHTESSTSSDVPVPLMHDHSVTNYRGIVDLNETFSNDEETVSINSEEFTERDIEYEEQNDYNRLCDICHLAQPPHETGDAAAWVFCPCEAMFHWFCAYDPSSNVRAVNCPMCGAITNS